MNVGFIGLGIMGKPMARNLLRAGYPLYVANRSQASVDALAALGAYASQYAQIAECCEVILTMLPDSADVREVVMDRLYRHLHAGQTVIDMSSIDPETSRDIAAQLQTIGVHMLDAPVSGGEPKAIDGTLSFMVGGEEEIFRMYQPLLLTMGQSAVYCGKAGAGSTVKLANQMIVAIHLAALCEGVMMAKRNGVEPEVVYRAIHGGLAGSAVMEAKVPMLISGCTEPGFRIDLHVKDLNHAVDAAAASACPSPVSSSVLAMMKELQKDGFGGCDHSALIKYYEKIAGECLADQHRQAAQ